jgi:hypothetical protein
MTGARGYSPVFYKEMKGYASFKVGYGYQPSLEAGGFAYEFEIGLHITKTIFTGFVYNSQNLRGTLYDNDYSLNSSYTGWRIGFNF